ncbi:hypothetical protein MRX96_044984 [Rhipicephalus microplus]
MPPSSAAAAPPAHDCVVLRGDVWGCCYTGGGGGSRWAVSSGSPCTATKRRGSFRSAVPVCGHLLCSPLRDT